MRRISLLSPVFTLVAFATVLSQGRDDPNIRAFADSLIGQELWSRIEVLRVDGANAMDPTNLDAGGNAYYAGHFVSRIQRTNSIDEWEQEVLVQIAEHELSSTTWRIRKNSKVQIHDIKPGKKDIKVEIKEVFPSALATALGFKHSSKTALRLKFGKRDYTIDEVRQAWKRVFATPSELDHSANPQVRSRISISGSGLSEILGNGIIDFGFVPTGYKPIPAKPDDYDIAIIKPDEEPTGPYGITGLLIITSQDANMVTALFGHTHERVLRIRKFRYTQPQLTEKLVIANDSEGLFYEIWGGEVEDKTTVLEAMSGSPAPNVHEYWIFDGAQEIGRLRVHKAPLTAKHKLVMDVVLHDRAFDLEYENKAFWGSHFFAFDYDNKTIALFELKSNGSGEAFIMAELGDDLKFDIMIAFMLADVIKTEVKAHLKRIGYYM